MLTRSERSGIAVLLLLVLIGCGRDLWLAWRLAHPDARDRAAWEAGSARGSPEHEWPELGRSPDSARLDTPRSSDGVANRVDRVAGGARTEAPLRVDLNRATASELDRLPGIGPVLAARIVAYRNRIGGFRTAQELLGVRGIGARLLARLEPSLVWPARDSVRNARR